MNNDDDQTRFYTGLPSYVGFTALLDLLSTVTQPYEHYGLSQSDQFLMVLMKLKQAATNQDLGYRMVLMKLKQAATNQDLGYRFGICSGTELYID